MLQKRNFLSILATLWVVLLLNGCRTNNSSESTSTPATTARTQAAPAFSADSAYHFIEQQLAFGPRVPNTPAHKQCGDYLAATLRRFGLSVTEQTFTATTYDGKKLNARNIIGAYNPSASKRILLAAHWDSRPFADEDPDPKNHSKPVLAANDGASGVAVLLELARVLSTDTTQLDLGVDIIFFDVEDGGNSEKATDPYSGFCLGSQYWAANRHQPGYSAYFGVLLDMVGAKGATFLKEGYSMRYASAIVRRVWNTASGLGYSHIFIDRDGPAITDDHVAVNEIAKIPMIDIIHTQVANPTRTFFDHWHTTTDDLSQIDPNVLKAVGQTLIQVLYEEGSPRP